MDFLGNRDPLEELRERLRALSRLQYAVGAGSGDLEEQLRLIQDELRRRWCYKHDLVPINGPVKLETFLKLSAPGDGGTGGPIQSAVHENDLPDILRTAEAFRNRNQPEDEVACIVTQSLGNAEWQIHQRIDSICQRHGIHWRIDVDAQWIEPGNALAVVLWWPGFVDARRPS